MNNKNNNSGIPCCFTKCSNCRKETEFTLLQVRIGSSDDYPTTGIVCGYCGAEYMDPDMADRKSLDTIAAVYSLYKSGEIDAATAQEQMEATGSSILHKIYEDNKCWICDHCGKENYSFSGDCWNCGSHNPDITNADRNGIIENAETTSETDTGDTVSAATKLGRIVPPEGLLPDANDDLSRNIDREILDQIELSRKAKGNSVGAWILLGLSLLAFAGAGVFRWDLSFVLLVAAVIFIHECGHLLAMKIFHYKNLKMMFLPFIGGVASGETEEEDSFKIALISIAGPLIGLLSCFIAVAGWLLTSQEMFLRYARISLFINVFNLLPIVPLDGGHYINETLFNRWPKAELVFRILAVIGLGVLAYFLHSIFLGIFCFFIFMSLKVTYNQSALALELRNLEGFRGGELTLEKVRTIRELLLVRIPLFQERSKNAGQLAPMIRGLWQKANKVFPGIGATVFLVVLYFLVTFVLSLFTLVLIEGIFDNI